MQTQPYEIRRKSILQAMLRFAALMGSLALGSSVLAAGKPADPVDWTLDPAHSRVEFKIRHLGLSWVSGHFKEMKATIQADPATGKVAAVEASASVSSLDTGMSSRDEHLQSPDFFDAASFPEIKAKLKKIDWKGNRFKAVVDLTLRDKTKSLTVDGEYLGVRKANFGKGDELHTGYSMSGVINRQDYGLKFNKVAEGFAVVGNEVKIEIEVEMTRPAG